MLNLFSFCVKVPLTHVTNSIAIDLIYSLLLLNTIPHIYYRIYYIFGSLLFHKLQIHNTIQYNTKKNMNRYT